MNYAFMTDLKIEMATPDRGILSRVLQKDDSVNITLFGFAAGEGLSPHAVPTPVMLYFIDGVGKVQLGDDSVRIQPGSLVYMPPGLAHAVSATSAVRMLLVQVKCGYQKS